MLDVKVDRRALANLQAELRAISRDLPDGDRKPLRAEMRAGMRRAAEMVAAEARRLAPVGPERTVTARDGTRVKIRPGRLRKSIRASVDPMRGRVAVVAGVRRRDLHKGSTVTRYRRPYWAAWANYGHDVYAGGAKGRLRVRSRVLRGTWSSHGRKVGRVAGARFMGRAMAAKAAAARREMQASLDALIRRYNRRIKAR